MTKELYIGGVYGSPWRIGGGVYFDSHGRLYPQSYFGTPGFGFSGGYSPDLEGLLTGPSGSATIGRRQVGPNGAISDESSGIGFGTRGAGTTYGFGPIEMSKDYSQPWVTPFIRESARSAGISSRYNVWEYGFPDANPPPADHAASANDTPTRILGRRVVDASPANASDSAPADGFPSIPQMQKPQKPLSLMDAFL